MKKVTLLLAFLFTFVTAAKSQQTVSIFGTVTEGGTATPIEFAVVFLKETNKNVETNAAGEYALPP